MKNILYIVLLSVCLIISIACENKRDDNGDLGGLWQLTEMRNGSNTVQKTKDDSIFWAVQLKLMKFYHSRQESNFHLAYFTHEGNVLKISSAYVRPKDTACPISDLSVYGVPSNGEFKIHTLSNDILILTTADGGALTFRKY